MYAIRSYYESLDAFKNGNVYGILPFNYYTTNIDTAMADSYYIGTVLYPEAFSDVDPVAKADEIYEFLVGKGVYSEMNEIRITSYNVCYTKLLRYIYPPDNKKEEIETILPGDKTLKLYIRDTDVENVNVLKKMQSITVLET